MVGGPVVVALVEPARFKDRSEVKEEVEEEVEEEEEEPAVDRLIEEVVVVVLLLLLLPPEPRFGSSSVGSEGHTPLSAATTTLGQHQYMLSQNYTLKLSTVHALD